MLSNSQKSSQFIKGMLEQVMIMTALAGFVTMLGALVDNILVGRYMGSDCVSSTGLINPLLLMCVALSSVFMSGGQINVSRKIGAGKLKEANGVFSLTLLSIVVLSLLVGVLLFIFCTPVAAVLGASRSPEILMPLTSDYVKGISIGMPAMMIMFCMSPYLQIDGDNKRLVLSMIAMLLTNIIGDLLAIFIINDGVHGMFYIALATSLSNIAGLFVIFTHFLSKDSTFKFSIKDVKWTDIISILGCGVPTGLQRTYSTVANLCMNLIVLFVAGVVGNAAQTVRGNVSALFLILGSSLGSATLTVASLMYGEENGDGLKITEKLAIFMSLKITVILAAIMFFLAKPISILFLGQNSDAVLIATQAIRFFAFALPFSSICDILFGYYQATTRTVLANTIPLLEYLVFPVGLSFILGHTSLGATGIWVAYPIAIAMTIVVLIIIISIREKKFVYRIADLALIPDGLGVSEDNLFECVAADMDSVLEYSRMAYDFCKEKSDDNKKAELVSLAIEELSKNIIDYGFKSVNNPSINLKLMWKNKEFILYIRDNCKPFNPRERAAIRSNDILLDGIGIPLVFGLINNIEYTNVLNMNNLRITI